MTKQQIYILKEDIIMSMCEETKKMIESCDEIMQLAMATGSFSVDDIASMDETTAKAFVGMCKLYKQSKDYMLKQAELMDKLERQNDELLEKVNVLLARTKAI